VESILAPILGKDNVHAQVTADVDFSSVEHTDESFKPNQDPTKAAIRSQQTSESNQQNGTPVGGVPGALSNQPPAAAVAPVTTPQPPRQPGQPNPPAQANQPAQTQTAEKTGPSSSRRDSTTNYELDRVVRHVQQAAGGVKRLSVAVVVNYRTKVDAKGKPVTEALSAKELAQIENLTKEAMGFSADRGDSLNVVNSPFTSDVKTEPELPLWKQPQMIDLAKTGVGYLLLALLAVFLWFKVARPVLRKYTRRRCPRLPRRQPPPKPFCCRRKRKPIRKCCAWPRNTKAISPWCATPRNATRAWSPA
jgi:flagellar M-ring protein FliF